MPTFLFTVSGYESKGHHVGFLPGIPQSLLINSNVSSIGHGSEILLVIPDGHAIKTTIYDYYININDMTSANPIDMPIIPIFPLDVTTAMIPLGTKVYTADAEG
ncbi:hypothetical protein R5W23_001811 [Gemmata sp. JC673]|uniref:IgGFc-binding protein N-terminal domain-containing protein n=1 Tax=Gemmata algarum TaxID=2975278 RepID=A0ABU5F1D1_9BACT|nr:hypothetical protein [Gemmata algarum]MDY3560567.1 hypothetical protein [Gemmata algarum]